MQGTARTDNISLRTFKGLFGGTAGSLILVVLNVIGAVVYLFRASHGWVIPEERGLNSTTAEPFIWFAAIFPVVAIFFVLDLAWGAVIIARRNWRSGCFCLLAASCWLAAVWIDFAHH